MLAFIGEIRMTAFDYAPPGWLKCDGQLLPPYGDYSQLFDVVGTTYGGDGAANFGVPDLRGRVPIHYGNGMNFGEPVGSETVALAPNELATHNHAVNATSAAATGLMPADAAFATSTVNIYGATDPAQFSGVATSVGPAGGGQPHENMQPYLCVNFIISLTGRYP